MIRAKSLNAFEFRSPGTAGTHPSRPLVIDTGGGLALLNTKNWLR